MGLRPDSNRAAPTRAGRDELRWRGETARVDLDDGDLLWIQIGQDVVVDLTIPVEPQRENTTLGSLDIERSPTAPVDADAGKCLEDTHHHAARAKRRAVLHVAEPQLATL